MTDKTMAIARCIVAAIIEIAGIIGFTLPIAEENLYCIVASLVMAGAYLWVWWKNNNVSHSASQAQILLNSMKQGDVEVISDVREIIDRIHEEAGIEDAE